MKKIFLGIFILFLIQIKTACGQNSRIDGENSNIKKLNPTIFCQRNDTIFCFILYSKESQVDSIKTLSFYTKLTKTKWISNLESDGTFCITKFRKKKTSKWFKENNIKWFNADFECKKKNSIQYNPNGDAIKIYHFLFITKVKKFKPKVGKNGRLQTPPCK